MAFRNTPAKGDFFAMKRERILLSEFSSDAISKSMNPSENGRGFDISEISTELYFFLLSAVADSRNFYRKVKKL
jgi:hypothetical protein